MSKLASEHVKVLISGEGGDEAFAGYSNYRNLLWLERLKRVLGPLRGAFGAGVGALGGAFDSDRLAKYAPLFAAPLEGYYLSRTSSPFRLFNRDFAGIYTPDFEALVGKGRSMEVARKLMANCNGYGPLEKMLYVDTKTWLPDDLLVKADKMTMANSVELRVPFLDHKVLEFAASLPGDQKVRGWTTKYLARKALRGCVPREILERRKAGFPIPYESWLRNQLKGWLSDILLDSRTLSRGYFERGAIERIIRNDHTGEDYSKEIFSLVVLELWHRTFLDGRFAAPVV